MLNFWDKSVKQKSWNLEHLKRDLLLMGGIRLKVGFQPLMVISLISSDCRLDSVVHAGVHVSGCRCGELFWTCHVWVERSRLDSLGYQTTDSIPPQVSRNESLRPFYWPRVGQPVTLLINAKRRAEKCKPPIFYVSSLSRSRSNHNATRERSTCCRTKWMKLWD